MSFGQVNGATQNREIKKATDDASTAFLLGSMLVQEGMINLDNSSFQEAYSSGSRAIEKFEEARQKFEVARDLIKEGREIEDLEEHLRNVNYQAKAIALDVRPENRLWLSIQDIVLREGAAGLFQAAAIRANDKKELSESFFNQVRSGNYEPIIGARLLARIGADLVFGAYASAIFIASQ